MSAAAASLAGKIAWVTGAGSGIGRATALALAEAGAIPVIGDVNAASLAETAALIAGESLSLVHDVTDEASWAAGVDAVRQRFGQLDVLVNNAGIMLAKPFPEAPLEHLRRQQTINVESVFIGMQAALPVLHEAIAKGATGASIINISSVYGMVAGAQFAAYSASKGAVRGLTRAVALELARTGIRVNCVLPGPVHTNLGADWAPPVDAAGVPIPAEVALAAWAATIPMGRLGEARDIAPLVRFLASDEARFITGAEFVADGGYTAA